MYNSPSVKIDNLRTKYKVNIKTYRKNNVHPAFTFLNTIYLNEKYINNEKPLMFAFFHELYHYNHNHSKIMLVIRLLITLTPILLFFFTWQITLTVWYLWGCVMVLLTKRFEKKANEYARSKTKKR